MLTEGILGNPFIGDGISTLIGLTFGAVMRFLIISKGEITSAVHVGRNWAGNIVFLTCFSFLPITFIQSNINDSYEILIQWSIVTFILSVLGLLWGSVYGELFIIQASSYISAQTEEEMADKNGKTVEFEDDYNELENELNSEEMNGKEEKFRNLVDLDEEEDALSELDLEAKKDIADSTDEPVVDFQEDKKERHEVEEVDDFLATEDGSETQSKLDSIFDEEPEEVIAHPSLGLKKDMAFTQKNITNENQEKNSSVQNIELLTEISDLHNELEDCLIRQTNILTNLAKNSS